VSGDIVSLDQAVTTTYVIKYNCQDLSGLDAPLAERIVSVQDRTAPVIKLHDNFDFQIEAGYPYVDAGATVYDDMSQTTTIRQTVTYTRTNAGGNPVGTGSTCTSTGMTTTGTWGSPPSAAGCTIDTNCVDCKWRVTYTATDASGNEAVPMNRIVTVKDTLAPIIVLTHGTKLTNEWESHASDAAASINHQNSKGTEEHTRSWLGSKMESSNNRRAPTTVHQESNVFSGMQLMAETTSVNGWYIGAIACAVTGVALLSLATRKTSVTEVPV